MATKKNTENTKTRKIVSKKEKSLIVEEKDGIIDYESLSKIKENDKAKQLHKLTEIENNILSQEIIYYKKAQLAYKNKYKKSQLVNYLLALLLIASIVGLIVVSSRKPKTEIKEEDKPQNEVINEDSQKEKDNDKRQEPIVNSHAFLDVDFEYIYNDYLNKAMVKDDYVGQIIFESGIINEPILKGRDNNEYLYRDYQTLQVCEYGPIFMDYECDTDKGNNIVLYGHNVENAKANQSSLFYPLHKLEKEKNFDDNKYIYLTLKDRVELYEVASVYRVKIVDDNGSHYLAEGEPQYYLDNYSKADFKNYIQEVKKRELYETGVEINQEDRLLTLQTAYSDRTDKLIVVAKLIDTKEY